MVSCHRSPLLWLMVFLQWLLTVDSSMFSKEDKVCDPSGKQLTRFTGFKIHRQYMVKDLKPPMLHFVSLSHCDDGNLNYERLIRTGRETDIQWDKPFCMLDPNLLNRTLQQQNKNSKRDDFDFPSLDSVSTLPHSVKPFKRSIKDKFNRFLRKMSSHLSFVEYVDDPLDTDLENLHTLTYKNSSLPLDSLLCYKLARRKKYALRELLIYAPYTFVGGIFQCDISDSDKQAYLDHLKDVRDFIKPFEFRCDPKNTKPLAPLLADNIAQQWIEKGKGTIISQRIPYLYSPGVLDYRYGKPAELLGLKGSVGFKDQIDNESSDKLPATDWYKEIDVNEKYTYSEGDLSMVTQAVTDSINRMKEFVKINQKYLPWEWDSEDLTGNPDSITYLEHKALSIISKMRNITLIEQSTKAIQAIWNNIQLDPESFNYDNNENLH